MASLTAIKKQPFAIIEIPLNKFYDEALPYHRKLYETHKAAVLKFMSSKNIQQIKREVKDKSRNIRQLKDLLYELDTLRAQVENESLDIFDTKTFALRKNISALIKDYAALEKTAVQVIEEHDEHLEASSNPFEGVNQIQMQESLAELKLKEDLERLNRVETLAENIEDLHGIYENLHQIVGEQKEYVDIIEENVENTEGDVNRGVKSIIKACKIRTAAYPVTGALIGTIIGGPLGLVAGLKVGGLAALGCGVAGYTGGRFFKQYNESEISNNQNENIENTSTEEIRANGDKKDI